MAEMSETFKRTGSQLYQDPELLKNAAKKHAPAAE
jgi:hypothetical protein